MAAKVVSKDRLNSVLSHWRKNYRVYAPVQKDRFVQFEEWEDRGEPVWEFQNSRLSPKFLMEPQSEILLEFSLDPRTEDSGILKERERVYPLQIVVGIRPCDAKAVELSKRNFVSQEYTDSYWVRRYETTVFVGLGCNRPCPTCFCTSVGCGPFHEEGLDVLMIDLGDRFLFRSLTGKGRDILAEMDGETPSADDEKLALQIREEGERHIVSRVSWDRIPSQDLMTLFDAGFWEDVAFSCINCGTCTFLCPTCWCFDIQDESKGVRGIRMRNWDSCMFPLFTLHGSGHNPRAEKFQRVRQRFMHKLKYYVDKYGDGVACVGCGRCVQFCPVNIDIREVAEKMNNYVRCECKV